MSSISLKQSHHMNNQKVVQQNQFIVKRLQKQINEQEEENNNIKQQIQNILESKKMIKLQDQKIELEKTQEQTKELHIKFKENCEQLKLKQKFSDELYRDFKIIKRTNLELAVDINFKQEKLNQRVTEGEELSFQINDAEKQKKQMQIHKKNYQKELNELQNNINGPWTQIETQKETIENLNQKEYQLDKEIFQAKQNLQYKNDNIRDIYNKNEMIKMEQQEKLQTHTNTNVKLKKEIAQLEQLILIQNQQNDEKMDNVIIHDIQDIQIPIRQMVKVHFDQIKPIIKRLYFQLQMFNKSEEQIFNEIMTFPKLYASLKELVIIFSQFPFILTNLSENVLFARYLLEDQSSNDQFTEQSEKTQNKVSYIKKQYKSVIQQYQILDNEQKQDIYNSIKMKVVHFIQEVATFLQNQSDQELMELLEEEEDLEDLENICFFDQFLQQIQNRDITLTEKEKDFLIIKSYQFTNSHQYFQYGYICAYLQNPDCVKPNYYVQLEKYLTEDIEQ